MICADSERAQTALFGLDGTLLLAHYLLIKEFDFPTDITA
jgi:hypothetical protein